MHGDPAGVAEPREHDPEESEAYASPPSAAAAHADADAPDFEDEQTTYFDRDSLLPSEADTWVDEQTDYYEQSERDLEQEAFDYALSDERTDPTEQLGEADLDDTWQAPPDETSRGRRLHTTQPLVAGPPAANEAAPFTRARRTLRYAPEMAIDAPIPPLPPEMQRGPIQVSPPQGIATSGPNDHGLQRFAAQQARARHAVAAWPSTLSAAANLLAEAGPDPAQFEQFTQYTPTQPTESRRSGVHLKSPTHPYSDSPASRAGRAAGLAMRLPSNPTGSDRTTLPPSLDLNPPRARLDSLQPQTRSAEAPRHRRAKHAWLLNTLAALPLCAALVGMYVLVTRPSPASSTPTFAANTLPPEPMPAPALTGFIIDSRPGGAEIHVDGKPLNALTPARVSGLTAGLHSVELSLAGYLHVNLPVQITQGAVLEMPAIELHPVDPAPALEAAPSLPTRGTGSDPADRSDAREARRAARAAKVAARAEARAAKVEARAEARAARADARAARKSHKDAAIAETEAPVEGAALGAQIPRTEDEPGMLRINSRPWAKIFIDDKFVGTTPQLALELDAGRHSVRLVNEPLGMAKTLVITIRGGETVTKIENLID